MQARIRTTLALMAVAAWAASPAQAATDYRQVSGGASISALGEDISGDSYLDIANSDGLNTGYVFGGHALHRSDSVSADANGWSAAVAGIQGSADVGLVHVQARVGASTSPVDPQFTSAGGWAWASAEWGDQLVLGTREGVYGTPIQVRFTIQLSGSGSMNRPLDEDVRHFPNTNFLTASFSLPQIGRVEHSCDEFMGACSRSWSYELTLLTVQPYTLSSYIGVNAEGAAWSYHGVQPDTHSFESGLGSAQGTSRMFIEVLTADAWYTLGSGLQLNPIPEAPTWAMMAGGLLLLVQRRRQRA